MQYTILLKPNNSADFNLIVDLAKRLKIDYLEVTPDETTIESKLKNNGSLLFEGLNIKKNITTFQFDNMPEKTTPKDLNTYNTSGFLNAINEVGGAWEKEEESLEEILEMLR